MTVEHTPWVGAEFREGLNGCRIALIGHSHHGEDDHADYTIECFENTMGGWRNGFFTVLPRYFGFEENATFWPRVMFFNFIPNVVGDSDNRFAAGTPEQWTAGRERTERLLREYDVEKAFVFTDKGWRQLTSWGQDVEIRQLGEVSVPTRRFGSTTAYGLRHPQGASKDEMSKSVNAILDDRSQDGRG